MRFITITISATLLLALGIFHMFITESILATFGSLSFDSKQILLMEWILEGITLIFIGVLLMLVTYSDKANTLTSRLVYTISSITLFSMAILSLFTRFNTSLPIFKFCPFLFSFSAILILIGAFYKGATVKKASQ